MATKGTSQPLNGKKIVAAGLLIAGVTLMLAYLGLLGFQVQASTLPRQTCSARALGWGWPLFA